MTKTQSRRLCVLLDVFEKELQDISDKAKQSGHCELYAQCEETLEACTDVRVTCADIHA